MANDELFAEMLDVLKRTHERYWELRDHDATNHEFSCVMTDVENVIAKVKRGGA